MGYRIGLLRFCSSLLLLLPSSFLYAESLFVEGEPDLRADDVQTTSLREFPSFTSLSKHISHSVVNISSESVINDVDQKELEEALPFFRKGPGEPSRSLGSGFIVNEDGHIVTNNHVIENATKIIVRMVDDREEYVAEIVGRDEKTDLALIRIETDKELTPLYLGNSDELEVGEWVLAVGNQFQLGQSVTAGIVSAKSRKVRTRFSGPYDQFIQTDAAINPGSSGGPLLNRRGQVVGINTAIFSPGREQFGGGGFNIGIGFAIPVNMAKGILQQLRDRGRVKRGLLGVVIQSVSKDISTALGLSLTGGALIADVIDGSPADVAGFKRRDVIVKFNGVEIEDHDDLPLMVASTPVGTSVDVEILRDGKPLTLSTKISELTEAPEVRLSQSSDRPTPDVFGLVVGSLNEELSAALGQKSPRGVVVKRVMKGSEAAKAGLQRGDVIEEVGNAVIQKLEDYERELARATADAPIIMLIRRKEGTRFLTLRKQ